MKTQITFTLLWLLAFYFAEAQDGSNIRYHEINAIDKSFEDRFCHLDFGKESFSGATIDTIEIYIKNNKVEFIEHRNDDGLNNWFNEQYLYAYNKENEWEMRLQDSRIDSVSNEKICLTSTINYYVGEGQIDTISIIQHCHKKSEISKILILEDVIEIQSSEPCQSENINGKCPFCSSKRKVLKTSPGTIVSYNFGRDSTKYIKTWNENVEKGYETYTNTDGEIEVINMFIESEIDEFWDSCNKWFCKKCKKVF